MQELLVKARSLQCFQVEVEVEEPHKEFFVQHFQFRRKALSIRNYQGRPLYLMKRDL